MERKREVIPKIFTNMVDFSCPQQPHQLNESTQLLSTREIKKKEEKRTLQCELTVGSPANSYALNL